MTDAIITDKGPVSNAFLGLDIHTFSGACNYVAQLPYKRNKLRDALVCVINEQCGTCSTKHFLLKALADELELKEVNLMIGVFLMDKENTPAITPVLNKYQLNAIPEAHCYLKINNEITDFTFAHTQIPFTESLIVEKICMPLEAQSEKVQFHKSIIRQWIAEKNIPYSENEIWDIREQCILALS